MQKNADLFKIQIARLVLIVELFMHTIRTVMKSIFGKIEMIPMLRMV